MSIKNKKPSIKTELSEGVLTVTLDRPKVRNAINAEMRESLINIWTEFRDTNEARVGILTGAGDRSFSAGADLKEIGDYYRAMTPIERREMGVQTPGLGAITRNFDPRKPIIAAINGPCLAGGLELALACDIRIAVEAATFGLPEVTRGILPGAGGTQRLPRSMPQGVALEMILTGAPIDSESALCWGLISHVVAAADLMKEATRIARLIAANGPLAVRAARDAVYQGSAIPLNEALSLEQYHAEPLRLSEDATEGVQAFIDKRPANFQGK